MAWDWGNFQENFNLVKTLVKFPESLTTNVEIYLQESAANQSTQPQYRPYWVCAKILEQDTSQQMLSSADGAVFTGMAKPIDSYYLTQRSIDVKNGWEIPTGFGATVEEEILIQGTGSIPNISVF
ncbi:MAG TPA: hypothetical protein VK184_08390 [Nostocaceae cyanobacterium]|nr:hypothetical protein [Nostocaceae cyanobacterium]